MVYESDFYTSRRPYSSRPNISSYSVTGQTFHRHVPAIGHQRIVVIAPSAHSIRTRPSVLIGEYDRIYHKVRPSLAYQPTEDYLNSRSYVSFDDETRSIRAQTADLLKRIHTPVPRSQRPLPLPGDLLELVAEQPAYCCDWHDYYPEEMGQTRLRLKLLSLKRDLSELGTGLYYSRSELPITDRITSDAYIDRLLSGTRDVARDINIMSHYEEKARHCNHIGQGHLACLSYARGRPISKRHNLAGAGDDYVRNDINVLSHYGRLRAAASAAATPPTEPAYEPPLHRPPTKSAVTGSWKSNAPRNAENQHKSENLTAGCEFDAAQDRKQRRRDAVEAAAQREVDEERRRKDETSRQDELAQQAISQREQELERKAREEQEAAQKKAEEAERLAREEEERIQREEEERLAAEELRLIEEEEARKKQEEDEKKAKKAKKEAEKKAKEEAEKRAKEEEEERRAQEAAERKAKEAEEERKAQEEEEARKAKEEADRKALEEERRAQEEAERLAKEEEERKVQESIAKENEERLAAEAGEAAAAEAASQDTETAEPAQSESGVVAEEVTEAEPVIEQPDESPVNEQVSEEPLAVEPAGETADEEAAFASEEVADGEGAEPEEEE